MLRLKSYIDCLNESLAQGGDNTFISVFLGNGMALWLCIDIHGPQIKIFT